MTFNSQKTRTNELKSKKYLYVIIDDDIHIYVILIDGDTYINLNNQFILLFDPKFYLIN